MADPKVELREVKEELAVIELQLAELLERQQMLMDKKQLLEQSIRDAASASTSAGSSNAMDWTKADFEWSRKLEDVRDSVFKLKKWRPLQLETMNTTLSSQDCILIMPTGGGKSLCFQLPALVSKGFTLVISPLVSLMEDQLMALHDLGINATLLNASSSREEVNRVHAAMIDKKESIKMLYVTPEKLSKSKRFMSKLEKAFDLGRLARLVIDEVHCCSQWGHDFRPDYKFLGVMKRQFPGVPILGLTATATTNVVQDVRNILGIQGCTLFRASFNRHNLYYEVRSKPTVMKECMADMQKLINSRFRGQSGIVYCFSRRDSEEVTTQLQTHGIQAGCYHSDTSATHRSTVHRKWLANKIQVVVATIAFGMGIDKPDVRFVIHHSMSKSMENYYQESGRAGRDDKVAHCILYASFGDIFRQSTMVFTEQTGLDNLYGMVAYAYNNNQCCRTLIARHFGERWDSTKCNGMCLHCDPEKCAGTISKDITKYGEDLLVLLGHARGTEQRVTGLKLLDAWLGKGAASLRVSSVKAPQLTREQCEQVVAYLLLHGYLREDFHFTPYNTISYLLPGPRSKLLSCGKKTLEITFKASGRQVKQSPSSSQTTSSQAGGSGSGKKSGTRTNASLKIINPEKSAFVDGPSFIPTDKEVELKPARNLKRSKVRKAIIESDSEDSELDFGEIEDKGLARKRSKLSNSSETISRPSSECITIDDDDDDDDDDVAEVPTDVSLKEKHVKNSNKLSLQKQSSSKETKSSSVQKEKCTSSSEKNKSHQSSKSKHLHSQKEPLNKHFGGESSGLDEKLKLKENKKKNPKHKSESSKPSKNQSKPSKNHGKKASQESPSPNQSSEASSKHRNSDDSFEQLYDTYTEQLNSLDNKVSEVHPVGSAKTKFSESFASVDCPASADVSMSSVGTNGEVEDLQNDYMKCLDEQDSNSP